MRKIGYSLIDDVFTFKYSAKIHKFLQSTKFNCE